VGGEAGLGGLVVELLLVALILDLALKLLELLLLLGVLVLFLAFLLKILLCAWVPCLLLQERQPARTPLGSASQFL
jgi:Flp pilus assembly protein TadB